MTKITLTEEDGLSYDDITLLQQAARIECVTVEEFIIAAATYKAEIVVCQDIEDTFSENY